MHVNIRCWEGYERKEFVGAYERENGVTVNAKPLLSDFDTATELLTKPHSRPDVLNINNAYIARFLRPAGVICSLDQRDFGQYLEGLLPAFGDLRKWCIDADDQIVGLPQRFGPFNLVVNTKRISLQSARDQGFHLADDPDFSNRFAILAYEDFNLFHLCLACELNPFEKLTANEIEQVKTKASMWCQHAALISDDHLVLNQKLIEGEIDFYLSGGIYTAGIARLAGHGEIVAVTPNSGPVQGKGGIAFAEINSLVDRVDRSETLQQVSLQFLHYLMRPESALLAAFTPTTCNPVAQMNNKAVFSQLTKRQLSAIQWESLEQDMSRCAHYNIMPDHDELLKIWRLCLSAQK